MSSIKDTASRRVSGVTRDGRTGGKEDLGQKKADVQTILRQCSRPHLSKSTFSAKPAAKLRINSERQLFIETFRLTLCGEKPLFSSPLQNQVRGFLGSHPSPRILSPTRWKFTTHGMTSVDVLWQSPCHRANACIIFLCS